MSENVLTTSNFYGKPAKRMDVANADLARVATNANASSAEDQDPSGPDSSGDQAHGEAVGTGKAAANGPQLGGNTYPNSATPSLPVPKVDAAQPGKADTSKPSWPGKKA